MKIDSWIPVHWLMRLLNPKSKLDYAIVGFVAAIPIFISIPLNVAHSITFHGLKYRGYLESYNWTVFIIILPFGLYIVRAAAEKLAGSVINPNVKDPPIVTLMSGYSKDPSPLINEFKRNVIVPRSLLAAILVSLLIHAIDMGEVVRFYFHYISDPAACTDFRERDWAVFFLTGATSFWGNFVFLLVAYMLQFIAATLGFWLVFLLFFHNCFFLRSIYQRGLHGSASKENNIPLNLQDPDLCFGLRSAYSAFNIQVLLLSVVGIFMLLSRFSNVNSAQNVSMYAVISAVPKLLKGEFEQILLLLGKINLGELFPDIGQWILALAWLFIFFVVAMPSMIKMLPFLGRGRVEWLLKDYLREFLPDSRIAWENIETPSEEDINMTSKQFAKNSFWPTGDNRAGFLFMAAFFIFIVLLFPLHFEHNNATQFIVYYVTIFVFSWGITTIFMKVLHLPLKWIDTRLVEIK